MYKINLTESDCSAIKFSGYRYSWSDTLQNLNIDTPGTHEISESDAQIIINAIKEDDGLLPLLSNRSNLHHQLFKLVVQVLKP